MSSNDDVEHYRRDYHKAYTSKNPIPTVQSYRAAKEQERVDLSRTSTANATSGSEHFHASDTTGNAQADGEYSSSKPTDGASDLQPGDMQTVDKVDTSEVPASAGDLKQRRKEMNKAEPDQAERVVTDPVTHLPLTIRDFTEEDLNEAKEKGKHAAWARTELEQHGSSPGHQDKHEAMENVFPPPDFRAVRDSLVSTYTSTMSIATGAIIAISGLTFSIITAVVDSSSSEKSQRGWYSSKPFLLAVGSLASLSISEFVVHGFQKWVQNKATRAWEEEVWAAQKKRQREIQRYSGPESTRWLNSLLASIWPLMNPEIFDSVSDMLEDVMQASLPRFIRMISIEDLGQGSEPLRILGVKWLPKGAASQDVSTDGELLGEDKTQQKSAASAEDTDGSGADGFEAEEGEFVNVEIAFAYRATDTKRRFRDREKKAHLYMAFYLPGEVKIPVWVQLQGLVGTLRARLQLTPDPPFVALCTMTFLGQPKVDMSCVPLVKHGLNIMDVPFISNFVSSAVDAAMSAYVAPKSLTLDLKSMLSGDDFKHDTSGRGIVIVHIKRAYDFKEADMSIPLVHKGASDPYVSVGWAKFGKPLFNTRVIVDEMHPYWDEWAHLVVGPEEIDAEESLRLQLWDSDRMTADDDLGRIEVDLKELMNNKESNGRMYDRTDTFEALRAGETMPGRLEWSVGYYSKAGLMDYQVAHKSPEPEITTVEQLKEYSFAESAKKLREAKRNDTSEVEQLKREDFEEMCTEMITTSIPTSTYPSGILSVQIHQIVGLQLESLNKSRDTDGGEAEDAEEESGDGLPDSYCTIILNDQKVFKTRTKPKSSKPFFNAGTERFVRDWRTASILVSVRDSRIHEADALLGFVHLPLAHLLRTRHSSRVNEFFPISGGIGHGRIRISLVFRSIELQPPDNALGWDWGTVELWPHAEASEGLPEELQKHRLKFRTPLGRGKMYTHRHETGKWESKNHIPIRLPVRKRYSTPLVVEFRTSSMLRDSTPAFAILWLQNIEDEQDIERELPVYKGDLARAETNVLPESEMGEKVGAIKVKLRFWHGLGRWHGRLTSKNEDVGNVMEVLQAAHDNGLVHGLVGDQEWLAKRDKEIGGGEGHVDEEHSTDSSGESEHEDEHGADAEGEKKRLHNADGENANGEENAGGFMSEVKGYMRHKEQLHRRHRGIMQWKAPRVVHSAVSKAGHTFERIGSMFDHGDRQADIEKEV